MVDNDDSTRRPMTDEERRALLEAWQQESLANMTPFTRYLYDTGQFDDVVRDEITADDVFTEPADLCGDDLDWEECIGYMKREGRVTYCTNPRHTEPSERQIPFDHCSYLDCVNCPGIITQGAVISLCTCPHHRSGH